MPNPFFTIVMPAYNEEECIEKVVKSWTGMLTELFGDKETKFIIINDGSKDKTGEILDRLAAEDSRLLVVHQPNAGHGEAVLNGYHKAVDIGSEWVFQVDSDDQFIPADFPQLWEKREQSNFIMGYRQKRYDEFHRLVITRILRGLNLVLFRTYLKDSNIPYRLIKGSYLAKLLDALPFRPFAPNIFLAVMAKKNGQKLFEIPITHKERETGQVSIVKWGLIKVSMRSAKELFIFNMKWNSIKKKLASN